MFAANWTLWVFTLMTLLRPGLSEMIADMNMYIDPDDMAYNLRNILDNAGLKQMQVRTCGAAILDLTVLFEYLLLYKLPGVILVCESLNDIVVA